MHSRYVWLTKWMHWQTSLTIIVCLCSLFVFCSADRIFGSRQIRSQYEISTSAQGSQVDDLSIPRSIPLRIHKIVSFSLALDALALDDYMDNILQTSGNFGFRVELRHPEELHLLYPGQDVLLTNRFRLQQKHNLEIRLDGVQGFSVDIDGARVFSRSKTDMPEAAFAFDDFAIGTGFSRQRPFQGSIGNFSFDAEYVPVSRTTDVIKFLALLLAGISATRLMWPRPSRASYPAALHRWLPPALVAILLLTYQLAYFRAYFPISEGWFSEYAHLIDHGLVPYRDFHLLVTPLYPYLVALAQLLFGDSIVALRTLGILLVIALGLSLYAILRRVFGTYVSAASATFGIIFYQRGNAFINYDYTQVVTLWMLGAAAFLCFYVSSLFRENQKRSLQLASALSFGFCLSLAVLTKHSNGGLCTVVLGAATILVAFRAGPWRVRLIDSVYALLGFSLPIATTVIYLCSQHAFWAFVSDVLLDASTAKGGIGTILTNAPLSLLRALTMEDVFASLLRFVKILLATMLVAIMVAAIDVIVCKRPWKDLWQISNFYVPSSAIRFGLVTSAISFATILFARFHICSDCFDGFSIGQEIQNDAFLLPIFLTLVGAVTSLVIYCLSPSEKPALWAIYSFFSIGLIWGNGTSAGFSEVGTFFGISILAAVMLGFGNRFVIPSFLPFAFLMVATHDLVTSKLLLPYSWWGIATPAVAQQSCDNARGILSGLCIANPTLAKIGQISASIRANSSADEAVYIYPNIPIFYMLSERAPYLNAVVSWPDFMSDKAAAELTAKLVDSPPPVIVVAELPPDTLTVHERLFRDGKASPQRAILAAIEYLKHRQIVVPVARVEDVDGIAISVFARSRSYREPPH